MGESKKLEQRKQSSICYFTWCISSSSLPSISRTGTKHGSGSRTNYFGQRVFWSRCANTCLYLIPRQFTSSTQAVFWCRSAIRLGLILPNLPVGLYKTCVLCGTHGTVVGTFHFAKLKQWWFFGRRNDAFNCVGNFFWIRITPVSRAFRYAHPFFHWHFCCPGCCYCGMYGSQRCFYEVAAGSNPLIFGGVFCSTCWSRGEGHVPITTPQCKNA